MASRIRDDLLYLVRALEGDLKVYEKQADLLFTLLNTLVASDTSNVLDRCTSSHELNFTAVASRASNLLSDQMVSKYPDTSLVTFIRVKLLYLLKGMYPS